MKPIHDVDSLARKVEADVIEAIREGRISSEDELETYSLVSVALESDNVSQPLSFSTLIDIVKEVNYGMLQQSFSSHNMSAV